MRPARKIQRRSLRLLLLILALPPLLRGGLVPSLHFVAWSEAPGAQTPLPREELLDRELLDRGEALREGEREGLEVVAGPAGRPALALTGAERAGVYTSPWRNAVLPFQEALLSWNVLPSPGYGLAVALRLRSQKHVTAWYSFGRFGAHPPVEGAVTRDQDATVAIDWLSSEKAWEALQYRVSLRGGETGSPRLDQVSIFLSSRQAGAAPLSTFAPWSPFEAKPPLRPLPFRLPVPFRSQKAEDAAIAGRICSPTSVAMALESHGLSFPTAEVAQRAFDPDHDLYGNWPANIQAAYSCGLPGRLVRLRRWETALELLSTGRPLVISIRDPDGVLQGAPYPRTAGHLLVLCGFDADGNPEVNDPAASTPEAGITRYDRGQLERVWLDQGGLTYLFDPPTAR